MPKGTLLFPPRFLFFVVSGGSVDGYLFDRFPIDRDGSVFRHLDIREHLQDFIQIILDVFGFDDHDGQVGVELFPCGAAFVHLDFLDSGR